jgi:hypothetical protein
LTRNLVKGEFAFGMVTRTYEVRTHGCQMNVHDSERIAGLLDEAGYAPVADGAAGRRRVGDKGHDRHLT